MTLQRQVCTLEQAIRLKELGCEQNAYFAWKHPLGEWKIYRRTETHREEFENISAYTVAELGVMLVCHQGSYGKGYDILTEIDVQPRIEQGWDWWYSINANVYAFPTEAQARAALLIHVLERRQKG